MKKKKVKTMTFKLKCPVCGSMLVARVVVDVDATTITYRCGVCGFELVRVFRGKEIKVRC